jgi:hypothetical protein
MRELLAKKFALGTSLAKQLKATAPAELIEGNTWSDTFWGQCPIGYGQNTLGVLLMERRGELLASPEAADPKPYTRMLLAEVREQMRLVDTHMVDPTAALLTIYVRLENATSKLVEEGGD